ncbi:hypothetical protein PDJAM_G00004600 [Pangasius djambal]|uniref:Uncharacterized protein n=1 Tax=Pangasius djambal TaxID=1691987 RepID=A0ACC5XYG2_9TELE|nr:hypothetical protein [Pangasius djambal]
MEVKMGFLSERKLRLNPKANNFCLSGALLKFRGVSQPSCSYTARKKAVEIWRLPTLAREASGGVNTASPSAGMTGESMVFSFFFFMLRSRVPFSSTSITES